MTVLSKDNEARVRLLEAEAELRALRAENARLRELLGVDERGSRPELSAAKPSLFRADGGVAAKRHEVSQSSSADEKIGLFRSLFIGRDDVHAIAWSSRGTGKSGWSPAVRGGIANATALNRECLPYRNEVLGRHLAGEVHIGIYPLLQGDVCRGRGSTVRRWTPCSWRSRSGSREAWCSTSAGSFDRRRTRRAWRSTTTWTCWCRFSPVCTMSAERPTPPSGSTCPREAEGRANADLGRCRRVIPRSRPTWPTCPAQ